MPSRLGSRHFGWPLTAAWPLLGPALLLCAIVAATLTLGDRATNRTVTEALIMLMLVASTYIFSGNSGVVSFGHAGFVAIGAYATAWQICPPALKAIYMPGLPDLLLHTAVPPAVGTIAAAALAAAVGLVIGIPLARLPGLVASIGTFCFLSIVFSIFSNWQSVTLGTGSLVGVPVHINAPLALSGALVTLLAAYLVQRSRYGLALRGIRDDEIAARAVAVRPGRVRLLAFVISAFFAGLCGSFYAQFFGILSVSNFYLTMTFMSVAMLVIGGIRSLLGAVVGVIAITAATELLRHLERGVLVGGVDIVFPRGTQEIAVGCLMLLILLFRPDGLVGAREWAAPWSLSKP
jgi:branched-chain amino acid transport system permease protein